MNRQMVVFGEDWGAHPSSTQHLIRALLSDWQVLWVNSIGLRRPRLNPADLRRIAGKLRGMTAPAAKPTPIAGLQVLQPRALSWPGNPLARRVNRALLGRQLRAEMQRLGFERPLLWMSLPTALDMLDELPSRGCVYYCGDDFRALDGVDHAAVGHLEASLAGRADLILAASEALAARFPAGRTHLLPHGVDSALFATPQSRPVDLPAGRPIAGFYGSLSAWVDVELLAAIARRLPDWNLVLIGPARCNLSALNGLTNVHLLGPRPHPALPGYVQHWQAALLPFRHNAQIAACNPLKLREYLASGTPVVSTDFPALAPYRPLLQVAEGAEAFVAAIRRAAGEHEGCARRRQAVAGESWQARAADLNSLLAAL